MAHFQFNRTVVGANNETLENIYSALNRYGAGQWVKGAYVSAAAIATNPSLEYLLETINTESKLDEYNKWLKICSDMVQYFES